MAQSASHDQVFTISKEAVAELQKFMRADPEYVEGAGIRVQMVPGGCAGMRYDFAVADRASAGDTVEQHGGLIVYVPSRWIRFFRGTSIDCSGGKGLNIQNPNSSSSCGCGQSAI